MITIKLWNYQISYANQITELFPFFPHNSQPNCEIQFHVTRKLKEFRQFLGRKEPKFFLMRQSRDNQWLGGFTELRVYTKGKLTVCILLLLLFSSWTWLERGIEVALTHTVVVMTLDVSGVAQAALWRQRPGATPYGRRAHQPCGPFPASLPSPLGHSGTGTEPQSWAGLWGL